MDSEFPVEDRAQAHISILKSGFASNPLDRSRSLSSHQLPEVVVLARPTAEGDMGEMKPKPSATSDRMDSHGRIPAKSRSAYRAEFGPGESGTRCHSSGIAPLTHR